MSATIRIDGISKRFGQNEVLKNVSLQIEAGELFFLLGPSGCGKTTLLRVLSGLQAPDEGRVFLGEEDVTELPVHRRDMGMVFQSYALWPHMTLLENVAFGLEMRKLPKAEIRRRSLDALALVKLEDRAQSRPNELSGGQQQRVALARALVVQPRCLLLDEPLSNLDAKLRLEMRTEIRRICKQAGLTAVYVTHDQKEALSIADRLAVLDQGTILQVGTPQAVYTRPKNRFVAQFIGEATFLSGRVVSSSGGLCNVETSAGVWQVESPQGEFASGEDVFLSIRPEAVQLHADAAANSLAAEIHSTIYLGETAQHEVTLPDGTALKALEMRPANVAKDAARIPTRIHIAPHDITLLRN